MGKRAVLRPVVVAAIIVVMVGSFGFAATETSHHERSFAAQQGGKLIVEVSFHQVHVVARPGDTVDITVDLEFTASESKAKRLLEDYAPSFEEQGTVIRVRSRRSEGGFSWGSVRSKGLVEVAMPPGMDLKVDGSSGSCQVEGDFGDVEVVCDTSSGSIKVDGAMRELIADASSGSVRVRLTRPAEVVEIDTSSGSVTVEGPVADINVNTSSGSQNLEGLVGSASLDASSGSITASWDSIPAGARVKADASSGSVRLSFPAGTELDGSVDTSSGGIRSDFPGDKNRDGDHMTFRGGADAVRLSVDTSSGGVQIRQR